MTRSTFLKLVVGTMAMVGLCTLAAKSNVCVEVGSGRYCSANFFTKTPFPFEGYTTEYGDFVPWSCEHTEVNSDAFPDGTERFLISTGPDFETVCNHQGYVGHEDCKEPQHPSWAKKTVTINYNEQHRVCVTNMPGVYEDVSSVCRMNGAWADESPACKKALKERKYLGDVTRCFDLYDIGER